MCHKRDPLARTGLRDAEGANGTYEIHNCESRMAVKTLERGLAELDLDEVSAARWFAGKDRAATAVELVDALEVPGSDGGCLVLVDLTHADGEIERYLLPLRNDPSGALVETPPGDRLWPALARAISSGAPLPGAAGSFTTTAGLLADAGPLEPARALSNDQSNTSVVLGERVVAKCYRRPKRGIHPEPEILVGLSHVRSKWAPGFGGALVHHAAGEEATLACVYAFVPGTPVGWEELIVRLRDLIAADSNRELEELAVEMGELGAAAAGLHVDLASAFGIETASETVALATLVAAQERLDVARAVAASGFATFLGARIDVTRSALANLDRLAGAPVIRCHGDLHVGQFIASPTGPMVIDFEGEPGRPVHERRQFGSPLRDLACLLLSFDHAAAAAARRLSFGPALDAAFAWSAHARAHAETAYCAGIANADLIFDPLLLRAFEVEKECHEMIYASTVLPEWSYAPELTFGRLLDGLARA